MTMLQTLYKHLFPYSCLLLLVGLLPSGCAPLYIPTATQTPTFDTAGQAQIAGYLATSGFDIQGAYSPWDNILVAGAFSYSPMADDTVNAPGVSAGDHSHLYGEFLAGYYLPVGNRWSTHFLAGFGIGNATYGSSIFDSIGRSSFVLNKGSYHRAMLQHYIAYKPKVLKKITSKVLGLFEVGIANRLAVANFYDITSNDIPQTDRSALYWEAVAVMKAGTYGFLFELQTGPVRRLNGDEPLLGLTHWWQWNMGLRLRL